MLRYRAACDLTHEISSLDFPFFSKQNICLRTRLNGYRRVIHHSPATPAILLLCFSFHSCVTISRVFSPFFVSRCSSIFHAGSFQLFYRPFPCARRPHSSASADPI